MDRKTPGEPEGEAFPTPSMMANVLAVLLLEMEAKDPGLVQRLESRLRSECARGNVVRIRSVWPEALLRQEVDRATKWLGAVALLVDGELGPLASRVKGKKGKR
jgi:hypothetical protein